MTLGETLSSAELAPSNAQANADITKAEIEAKLTGEISSHTHAGGGGAHAASHQNGGADEISVAGLSGVLADPQTPIATAAGLALLDDADAAAQRTTLGLGTAAVAASADFATAAHNHTGVYEPANANIQAHVASAHAPSNAQKNSDILKAEIEAVLTGTISSHSHSGGPGGGAAGTATLDFGAFPGSTDTSVAVTGQTTIVAGSVVDAWIRPVATADHSADEHLLEQVKVLAGNIVAGTGFTVYGFNDNRLPENPTSSGRGAPSRGPVIYGTWTVAWSWV